MRLSLHILKCTVPFPGSCLFTASGGFGSFLPAFFRCLQSCTLLMNCPSGSPSRSALQFPDAYLCILSDLQERLSVPAAPRFRAKHLPHVKASIRRMLLSQWEKTPDSRSGARLASFTLRADLTTEVGMNSTMKNKQSCAQQYHCCIVI